MEFSPCAQSCPLDVTTDHAAYERRADAGRIGEFAPQFRIEFNVKRNSASPADLIRVGFLSVKDHRTAGALADLVPRAFEITAAEYICEEGRGMAMLRQARPWIVGGLESMQTGPAENPSNVARC